MAQSVARQWNEVLLDAVRMDFPAPTVNTRNLYHTSAAMFDAWAAFDPIAIGKFHTDKVAIAGVDVPAARNEAISYAAYRVLSQRYQLAVDPVGSQSLFDNLMGSLGYDPAVTTTVGNSAAAIGNRIADQILTQSFDDGANEANGYVDNTGYQPTNAAMVVDYPGLVAPGQTPLADPNRWQPLFINSAITQNGLEGEDLQTYVGPHWGDVTPFAMGRNGTKGPYSWSDIDPGAPPMFKGVGDKEYRDDTVLLIRYSQMLDPNQGPGAELINISPNSFGNRPLGTHNDQGYSVNPMTNEPYADNFVKRADYGRILAEFWADGPNSETPPGHWNVLANRATDHPTMEKRIGGTGDIVGDLEWDVKMYMALNGAEHDAAIAAWGSKRVYDYVRPITKIRYQGSLGQSSDVDGPSYHADGLPLETGLIELITAETIAEGGEHRNAFVNANRDSNGDFASNYTEEEMVGKVTINSWNHEPSDPETETSGIDWILAENWVPYQDDNFVTPAFAAYVSGHSTFSRTGAEILTAFTGSEYFPGGMGETSIEAGALEFESGPAESLTLQWATYFDAADEAGISRLWGGIHVPADDFAGRIMGAAIGQDAFDYASELFVNSELGWHNAVYGADVTNDRVVAPLDALLVINELSDRVFSDQESGQLVALEGIPPLFYDVDNDGFVSPVDALLVINALPSSSDTARAPLNFRAYAVPEPSFSIAWLVVALGILQRRKLHLMR